MRDDDKLAASSRHSVWMMRHWVALAASSVLASTGCTPFEPGEDTFALTLGGGGSAGQASSMDDSGGGGMVNEPPGPPGPWDCLEEDGRVVEPPLVLPMPSERPEFVVYAIPIVDFTVPDPNNPPADVTIEVCPIADQNCQGPLPNVPIGPAGPPFPAVFFAVPMPFGFEGYLRITAPGYVQTEYYWGGPMVGTPGPDGVITAENAGLVVGGGVKIPRDSAVTDLFAEFGEGAERNIERGILGYRLVDCLGAIGVGIGLEGINLDAEAFRYTIFGGLPVRNILETDDEGIAGLANVLPGTIAVRGITPGGTYGRTTARIRAGQLTAGEIRPSYRYGR